MKLTVGEKPASGKLNRRLSSVAEYLNKTKLTNAGRNQVICDYDKPPQEGKVCAVDVNSWGPCSRTQSYGFNNSSPCVFIKLNRVSPPASA